MVKNNVDYPDTIFAVSTGMGKCAVAIVRVSGPHCARILEKLCPQTLFKDRVATLASILDKDQFLLDRGIVIRFFGPRSFTGEDMIEFQVTGSRAVLTGLIRSLGAFERTRPADAGEFARRAFENGKLDLVEVEGLAAVIDAETSIQLRHALAMTSGQLSRQCENVRSLLICALADVESLLDFSDIEDTAALSMTQVLSTVEKARSVLENMIDESEVSERVRDGLTVAIAGPANVGKSTLLNRLAKREVAIVSPLAGTTRDSLEVALEIFGYPVTFIDTAGIRETSDPIEAEGIARARVRTANADLVLWLSDGNSSSLSLDSERPVIRVRTKVDLPKAEIDSSETIAISALTGFGVDRLIDKIGVFAKFYFAGAGTAVFGTERQRGAVRDVSSSLRRVVDDPRRGVETIAEDLRFAIYGLSRITGRIEIEEVLSEIFSRFCVGK